MFTNMDLFSLNLSFQTFHKLRKNLKRKNYRINKEKVIDFFFDKSNIRSVFGNGFFIL